jgi:hypothetical protein
VSELRSAIDEFESESLAELPDAQIEEDFAELHRAIERLELQRLRRLAEIDRRRLHERDGHLSASAWLATVHRVPWGRARADLQTARSLGSMPITRRALIDGEISFGAARLLVEARKAEPTAFARCESELVRAAGAHSMSELQKVTAFWRQRAERERGIDPEERQREQRNFHASVTWGGMVRVDGDLDPETGESLLTALEAVLDAEAKSRKHDPRTPAQRRADALDEICRGWLDSADRARVGGERPHVTVTISADQLAQGDEAELDHTGPIDGMTAKRISCDASVRRVVISGRSEPLDVGRRTPVVPASMRRAVIVRDRTCRFPGCDRPHAWCDAHHVRHRAEGGHTKLSNLVLLCRRHHRLIHGGFQVEIVDGRPLFRRRDGTILEDRAPP